MESIMKGPFSKGGFEMQSAFLKVGIGFVVLLSVMFAAGCATTGAPFFATKADNPGPIPSGSSYVNERRDSGSFGSATVRQTFRALGEQTWQGRKVYASEGPEGTLLSEVPSLKWVAFVKEGKTLFSWDPPLGYNYPLWVGKTWTEVYRITNHVSGKTSTVEIRWNVEAKEEVKVPAGTFKVFRVTNSDPTSESITWWSPELGIFVKFKSQRTEKHPLGPGVRETELISHDIRR
jgi:hypothetical protein